MMKYFKILFVAIFAILIELFVFNFDYVYLSFVTKVDKNIEYELQDATLVNWQRVNGYYISESDPMIIFNDLDTDIKNVCISVDSQPIISNLVLFYTNYNMSDSEEPLMIVWNKDPIDGEYNIEINNNVKNLRIDLGDDAGTTLKEFKLIVNPAVMNFSSARTVAMILIYVSSKLLFRLQRKPKYNIDNGEII